MWSVSIAELKKICDSLSIDTSKAPFGKHKKPYVLAILTKQGIIEEESEDEEKLAKTQKMTEENKSVEIPDLTKKNVVSKTTVHALKEICEGLGIDITGKEYGS